MNPSSPLTYSYSFPHEYLSLLFLFPCHPNAALHRKRRQLATLIRLKTLLARKKAIENEILAAVETMAEACENFGEVLRSDNSAGLDMEEI